MNIKKLVRALTLCAGVVVGHGAVEASIIKTVADVKPGVWSSDLDGAKAAAMRDNIPMLLFWGNTGCSHCEALEKQLNGDTFTEWMAENRIYMVFKEADKSAMSWIKSVAKDNGRKISAYPFALVYWPKNASGHEVLQAFSAYKGNMGEFGANSKKDNLVQFMTALEYLLDGWNPGGVDPVDPVDPTPVGHTHSWSEWKTVTTATCTEAGEQVRTCSVAGCPSPKETRTVKALGHDWSAWSEVKPASVGVEGLAERSCKRCDKTETKSIPAIDPVPEREEVDPAKVYSKAKKFDAIAYDGDDLFGKVAVSIGNYNSKRGYSKITVKISSFNGKTFTKSVNAMPNEYGDFEDVMFKFKNPVGEMLINIVYEDGDFEIIGEGDEYSISTGEVSIGGLLDAEEMYLSIEMDELEPESEAYEFIIDAPSGAAATVKGGKSFNFGSAPKIKYVKHREDGETWYELAEYDEERYPNVNAVKLTYNPNTGAFSGSFSVYASNEGSIDYGKKPKLKTYKGSFSGMVVDGAGVGSVAIKVGKRTYTGACNLE